MDTSRDHSNNNSFFVKAMKTWGNEELDDDATFKKKLNQLKRVSKTNKGANDNNGPRSKFCQPKKDNPVFSPEVFLKTFEPKVSITNDFLFRLNFILFLFVLILTDLPLHIYF
jgi:hypothetical protein